MAEQTAEEHSLGEAFALLFEDLQIEKKMVVISIVLSNSIGQILQNGIGSSCIQLEPHSTTVYRVVDISLCLHLSKC